MHCFLVIQLFLESVFVAAANARGESECDEKTESSDNENSGETGEVLGPLSRNSIDAGVGRRTILSVVKEDIEVRRVAETGAAELSLQKVDGLESVFSGSG